MVVDQDHQPYIFGQQYLSIFAQPSRLLRMSAQAPPPAAQAGAQPSTVGFDPTPTGSIPSGAVPAQNGARDAAPGIRLVGISQGRAWFENGQVFEEFRSGDRIPQIGQIDAIQLIDGQWTIVLKDGAMIRAGDDGPGAGDGRFARPMIFDR
jgi:hypothetical protein